MPAALVGIRTKETTTTTGTGTYSLAGASFSFQTFVAAIGTGNTCFYVCTDVDPVGETGDWEFGVRGTNLFDDDHQEHPQGDRLRRVVLGFVRLTH